MNTCAKEIWAKKLQHRRDNAQSHKQDLQLGDQFSYYFTSVRSREAVTHRLFVDQSRLPSEFGNENSQTASVLKSRTRILPQVFKTPMALLDSIVT